MQALEKATKPKSYVPGGPLTVNGTDFAPDDQQGPIYRHALTESHDDRFRDYERNAYAAFDPATSGHVDLRSHLMGQADVPRQAGMWGPQGTMSATGWAPWYESINAISDQSGKEAVVSARGMGGTGTERKATGRTPLTQSSSLPPGYSEDRYKQELDAFAAGGKAPAFAGTDFRSMPEVGERFQREVAQRQQQAPSMRALAKQGGY